MCVACSQISLSVLVTVVIVCTQLWSTVSWLVQFKRLFTVCFLISIIWNWFYLYKVRSSVTCGFSESIMMNIYTLVTPRFLYFFFLPDCLC